MGLDFVDDCGLGDLVPAVSRYVPVVHDEEGICAKEALTYAIGAGFNALAQVAKFVGVG